VLARAAKRQKRKRRRVVAYVSCPDRACTATVTAKLGRKRLKAVRRTLRAGRRTRIVIRLPRTRKRAVSLAVTARAPGLAPAQATARVRLVR
jgi:hypothetical protein